MPAFVPAFPEDARKKFGMASALNGSYGGSRSFVNRDVVLQVRRRSQDCCEYCHLPASVDPWPFHIDNVIASSIEGSLFLRTSHTPARTAINVLAIATRVRT